MKIRLEALLSWLTVITAAAYSLGWLKSYYYFDAFGIGLSGLGLSVTDYLFESWFVIENVVFLLLLAWFVVKTRYWWSWVLLVIVVLTPILSHYAFVFPNSAFAQFLINYRHDVMKFIPLGVYVAALIHAPTRTRLKNLSWSASSAAGVYTVILLLAWSISTAKHFGSFDAARAQSRPDDYFSHVAVHGKNPISDLDSASDLYLIYATPQHYLIWNHEGFQFGAPGQEIKVVVVARDQVEWAQTSKKFQVQPGSLFF